MTTQASAARRLLYSAFMRASHGARPPLFSRGSIAFGEGDEVVGMTRAQRVRLAARLEQLRCEFAHRLQHRETRFVADVLGPLHEVVIDER